MDIVSYLLAKSYTDKTVAAKASGMVYKGSILFDSLPTPSAANLGWLYTVTDKNNHEYVSDSNAWVDLSSELDLKQDAIYSKDTVVTKTVGGLERDFNLKGHTITEILERLVGGYDAPEFTKSTLNTTYTVSNTRAGAAEYVVGDTVSLDSVYMKLTKGTDFNGLISGVVNINGSVVYHLTNEDIQKLGDETELTINFTDATYTFPSSSTSGTATFSVGIVYSKKSYDPNEQVITTNTTFSTTSKSVQAYDKVVYSRMYYGAIPSGKVVTGLTPAGVVSYSGGSQSLIQSSELGTILIEATDENNQAIILVESPLTDIKFMTVSNIDSWTRTSQTMSYTRDNGTVYTKLYYIYTNTIATGTFTYVLE